MNYVANELNVSRQLLEDYRRERKLIETKDDRYRAGILDGIIIAYERHVEGLEKILDYEEQAQKKHAIR